MVVLLSVVDDGIVVVVLLLADVVALEVVSLVVPDVVAAVELVGTGHGVEGVVDGVVGPVVVLTEVDVGVDADVDGTVVLLSVTASHLPSTSPVETLPQDKGYLLLQACGQASLSHDGISKLPSKIGSHP